MRTTPPPSPTQRSNELASRLVRLAKCLRHLEEHHVHPSGHQRLLRALELDRERTFGALWQELEPLVQGFVARRVRGWEEGAVTPQDICNETAAAVWTWFRTHGHRGDFQSAGCSARAFVLRFAIVTIAAETGRRARAARAGLVRTSPRHEGRDDEEMGDRLASTSHPLSVAPPGSPEDAVVVSELDRAWAAFRATLPPSDQAVLARRSDHPDETWDETAARVAPTYTAAALRQRISRARRDFAATLEHLPERGEKLKP